MRQLTYSPIVPFFFKFFLIEVRFDNFSPAHTNFVVIIHPLKHDSQTDIQREFEHQSDRHLLSNSELNIYPESDGPPLIQNLK